MITDNKITYKIYELENKITGETYVGKTTLTYWKNRIANHKWHADRIMSDRRVHRNIRQYGIDNFNIQLHKEYTQKNRATELEKSLIREYSKVGLSLNSYLYNESENA